MTSMEITEDGERVKDGALHITMQLTTNIFASLPAALAQPEEVTHPPTCTVRTFHARSIRSAFLHVSLVFDSSAAVGWHTAS